MFRVGYDLGLLGFEGDICVLCVLIGFFGMEYCCWVGFVFVSFLGEVVFVIRYLGVLFLEETFLVGRWLVVLEVIFVFF